MSENNFSNNQLSTVAKVLVVSDNFESARIWCLILRQNNIDAMMSGSAEDALRVWAENIPDFIVIDIHGSEFDGVGLTKLLREFGVVPILMLTPRNNETHILEAYLAGADECVIKPISPALFMAKVKVWLRRTWSMPTESLDVIQAGGLQLDPSRRQVMMDTGVIARLTNLEFRLLHVLMMHPGWALTTEEIILKVWGYYGNGDSNLLKNLVYRLRRKIDPDPNEPRYIHTESGIGYKFLDLPNRPS